MRIVYLSKRYKYIPMVNVRRRYSLLWQKRFHNVGYRNGILRYERIFGDTFVSTGGLETTKEFTAMMDLKPGMKVIDIGCGIGGSAFHMARAYQVEVLGVDLSSNMLAIANEHKARMEPEVQERVTFKKLDATTADFGEAKFDVMYSRDAIMHIADKTGLYSKVFVSSRFILTSLDRLQIE